MSDEPVREVVLIADASSIVLKSPLARVRFDIPQTVTISLREALTGDGLRFAPDDLTAEAVTFYTFPGRREDVEVGLRRLGWVIAEPEAYRR